jgi:hypothetical protein
LQSFLLRKKFAASNHEKSPGFTERVDERKWRQYESDGSVVGAFLPGKNPIEGHVIPYTRVIEKLVTV